MNIARKLRTWFPGAVYHIMHRGVRRKAIFQEEMDYQVLLQVLKNSLEKYKCILHAYCLMTNHIHLLLETGDMEIWKFMKYMSECYAMYLNHKYSYRGHVFESRYKSCLVKEDAYFLVSVSSIDVGIIAETLLFYTTPCFEALTDKISAEASGKNIMFSPTSLNVALGMIAEKKDPRKTRVLLCINKMTASYCGSGMLLFIPEFLTLHFRLSIWGIRHPSDFEPVIFGLSGWDIYIVGFGGRCSFIQRYLKIHCYLCNGIT